MAQPTKIKVKQNVENEIVVVAKGSDDRLDFRVEIDGEKTIISQVTDRKTEIKLSHFAKSDIARIRIDRTSAKTPFIYEIKVK